MSALNKRIVEFQWVNLRMCSNCFHKHPVSLGRPISLCITIFILSFYLNAHPKIFKQDGCSCSEHCQSWRSRLNNLFPQRKGVWSQGVRGRWLQKPTPPVLEGGFYSVCILDTDLSPSELHTERRRTHALPSLVCRLHVWWHCRSVSSAWKRCLSPGIICP